MSKPVFGHRSLVVIGELCGLHAVFNTTGGSTRVCRLFSSHSHLSRLHTNTPLQGLILTIVTQTKRPGCCLQHRLCLAAHFSTALPQGLLPPRPRGPQTTRCASLQTPGLLFHAFIRWLSYQQSIPLILCQCQVYPNRTRLVDSYQFVGVKYGG